MDNLLCGAKTRSGTACRKKPMKNGRCYMHGGARTGPKDKNKHRQSMLGNKNSLKTGEYEKIWFNTMSTEDIRQYELTPTNALEQLDHEIKLTDIREKRMMKRIREAERLEVKDKEEKILRLEESITRVQNIKSRLIEQKMRLLECDKTKEEPDSLEQLASIIARARKRYSNN